MSTAENCTFAPKVPLKLHFCRKCCNCHICKPHSNVVRISSQNLRRPKIVQIRGQKKPQTPENGPKSPKSGVFCANPGKISGKSANPGPLCGSHDNAHALSRLRAAPDNNAQQHPSIEPLGSVPRTREPSSITYARQCIPTRMDEVAPPRRQAFVPAPPKRDTGLELQRSNTARFLPFALSAAPMGQGTGQERVLA